MNKNVCWKSTLRQPMRTLSILLLVGLVSFAFVSRAAEYLIINRETDRLAGYYRGIGVLETVDSNNQDVAKGAEMVARSQYVSYEDKRMYFSGVLQDLYNADVDGWMSDYVFNVYRSDPSVGRVNRGLHINEVVLYGELSSKYHNTPFAAGGVEEYEFYFHVKRVVAGYPGYVIEHSTLRLRCYPENPREFEEVYESVKGRTRYYLRAYYNPSYNRSRNSIRLWASASQYFILKPLTKDGLWFQPVEPGATVDLSDPALAGLAEELRVTEENRHTMQVVSTKDMSAMPDVQEASQWHYLDQGRWLDREDDLNSNRVCVVHRDFAQMRDLSIGDTLTVKLRELKTPLLGYIVPGEDWDAWQDYEAHTETFEIVGLYGTLSKSSQQPTVYSNYMYIPDSSIPSGYGGTQAGISQGSYSFVLRSPDDEEAFLAENQESLAALGLRVSFLENGWENFQTSVSKMKQSAAMSAGVFALVLVLALALATFLYLRQRQRDFAILRSLGVPKNNAMRQMLQPIALVGVIGVLLGGLPSWRYALGKATEALASLKGPTGVEHSTLSVAWLAALCTGVFALLLLFAVAGTLSMARRPALELLQGTVPTAGRDRKSVV